MFLYNNNIYQRLYKGSSISLEITLVHGITLNIFSLLLFLLLILLFFFFFVKYVNIIYLSRFPVMVQ